MGMTLRQCYDRGLSPTEAAYRTGMLVTDVEDVYDMMDMEMDFDGQADLYAEMSDDEVMAMADYYENRCF